MAIMQVKIFQVRIVRHIAVDTQGLPHAIYVTTAEQLVL
jgi:hypothetical protein